MPIRPVDLQTMLPKIPEVQKAKSVEAENLRNNMNINLHKEQQQNEKNLKQVNETKKPYQARINKDEEKKNRKEKKKKDDGQAEEDTQRKPDEKRKKSIDIRI